VDHHCHRCGAVVADNAPFCSQCGAPQIRVPVGQEAGPQTAAPPPPLPPIASRVAWKIALPRVLGAAVVGTILLMIFARLLPPFLVIVLIIPFTGALSVWFYKNRDAVMNGAKGFRLGLVTGFFLFVLNLIAPVVAYFADRQQFIAVVKQQLDQAAKNDPRSQEMINGLTHHPETIVAILVIASIVGLFMFTIACGIGGAIAGRGARHG
jgi:hypothetical protein